MKKYYISFILISLVFIPFLFLEAAVTTTGFVPGQIWYSKDPFVEGDTVKIYTALWNNEILPLSLKVEFYDKNIVLGTRSVIVPGLSLADVYVSWKVTSGDHSISAKITSSTIVTSGKKEDVKVSNVSTGTDKRFVPVVIKTIEGKPATTSDVIKNEIDKATSSIGDILPESVSVPVFQNVNAFDNFRANTFGKIVNNKNITKKVIEEIKKDESATTPTKTVGNKKEVPPKVEKSNEKVGIEQSTKKPIAYLKLILLSVLSFIFGSKIVFYLLVILILFWIFRFIYRSIRK